MTSRPPPFHIQVAQRAAACRSLRGGRRFRGGLPSKILNHPPPVASWATGSVKFYKVQAMCAPLPRARCSWHGLNIIIHLARPLQYPPRPRPAIYGRLCFLHVCATAVRPQWPRAAPIPPIPTNTHQYHLANVANTLRPDRCSFGIAPCPGQRRQASDPRALELHFGSRQFQFQGGRCLATTSGIGTDHRGIFGVA